MAQNPAYKLLKKHTIDVEGKMEENLVWFANELSTEEFRVLDDNLANDMKNPVSVLRPDQKAIQMFKPLLNWVKQDPDGLIEFVKILKKDPVRFKILIQKLDSSKFGLDSGQFWCE